MGQAVCIALLDYLEINPISRIPLSQYRTLEVLISHYNSLIDPKKRLANLSNRNEALIRRQHQRNKDLAELNFSLASG